MSYVSSNLIAGERVLYKTGLHWIVLTIPFLLGGIFGLTGLLSLFAAKETMLFGLVAIIFAAACFYLAILKRNATEMAVTNKRVVIKIGLIRRRTYEILLTKIESIGVKEGLLGRIAGYGTVVVRGTGGTPEPFRMVGHPLEFRRQVQQQIENAEQTKVAVVAPQRVLA